MKTRGQMLLECMVHEIVQSGESISEKWEESDEESRQKLESVASRFAEMISQPQTDTDAATTDSSV